MLISSKSTKEMLTEIETIEKTITYLASSIVNELPKFYDDKHGFQVSIKRDEAPVKKEYTTASFVIARILFQLNDYAPYYLNKKKWRYLYDKLTPIKRTYIEGAIERVLPLNSFGFMPLFSTAHLCRSMISLDKKIKEKFVIDHLNKSCIDTDAFIISFLRILVAVKALQDKGDEHNIPDYHPYLLNSYYSIIKGFLMVISEHNGNQDDYLNKTKGCIENFYDNKKIRKEAPNKNIPQDFIYRNIQDWNILKKELEGFLSTIERAAYHKVLNHLEWASNCIYSDYDPASLAYAVYILGKTENPVYKKIIFHSLDVIVDSMRENGIWHSTSPFHVDDKGRAIYVTSFQVAQIVAASFSKYSVDLYNKYQKVLNFLNKFNYWLNDHRHDFKEENFSGWCSDDAPDNRRIDSWVTAHTLKYCIQQLRLLENMKKLLVLKQYSHIPIKDSNAPKENNLPQPWTEEAFRSNILDKSGKQISLNQLQSFISGKNDHDKNDHDKNDHDKKAPTFILYGPPGTSKTTLAEKVAEWLKWDLLKLSPSDFVADGIEKIENKSREIFYHLMKLHKTVIVFDEMDSLFRSREIIQSSSPGTMLEFIVPAFLPKLQELSEYSKKHQIAVFCITNYYGNIDNAIKRAGRFDRHFLMLPLKMDQQFKFILDHLKSKNNVSKEKIQSAKDKIFELLKTMKPESSSKLLVFRENESLANQIYECIDHDNIDGMLKIKVINESVTPEFYQNNTTAKEELNIILEHLKTDYDIENGLVSENGKVDIPEEWKKLGNIAEKHKLDICALLPELKKLGGN
jgi:adenylate kinase family enzyme